MRMWLKCLLLGMALIPYMALAAPEPENQYGEIALTRKEGERWMATMKAHSAAAPNGYLKPFEEEDATTLSCSLVHCDDKEQSLAAYASDNAKRPIIKAAGDILTIQLYDPETNATKNFTVTIAHHYGDYDGDGLEDYLVWIEKNEGGSKYTSCFPAMLSRLNDGYLLFISAKGPEGRCG